MHTSIDCVLIYRLLLYLENVSHLDYIILHAGSTNTYVSVNFKTDNRIDCVFLTVQENQLKPSLTCDIVYGPCQQTSDVKVMGTATSSNTVTIDLPLNLNSTPTIYCYTINASNGTFTTLVKGKAGWLL